MFVSFHHTCLSVSVEFHAFWRSAPAQLAVPSYKHDCVYALVYSQHRCLAVNNTTI